MKRVTTWSPDTCGCVISYEWDDAVPQDQRTHTHKESICACPAHTAHVAPGADKKLHLDKVIQENKVKNIAHDAIKQEHPELEAAWKWSFDENRDLVVDLPGSTAQQRNQIKTNIDGKLGHGKTKVK